MKSLVLQLTEDLARAGADREVRAIVLRGEGKVTRQGMALMAASGAGVLIWPQPEGDDSGDWL